jgi:DNA polymerase III epsilon subunit-like protein
MNLLRYNKNQKYLVFDFETNCLNLAWTHNKPWQLSYAVCRGDTILETFDHIIYWPDFTIKPEIAAMNHFTWERYRAEAKDPVPILEHFESYLYNDEYLIVGQNILWFDVYIHNIYNKLLNKKTNWGYLERCLDTKALAIAIKKGLTKNSQTSRIIWQYKLGSIIEKGLKTSILTQLKELKIDFDESRLHDSLYDIRMNFEIFKKRIWEIEI